jgi:hypothetical protein
VLGTYGCFLLAWNTWNARRLRYVLFSIFSWAMDAGGSGKKN